MSKSLKLRTKPCKFTEEEAIQILLDTIEEFTEDTSKITYTDILLSKDLPHSTFVDYKNRHKSVKYLADILTQLWISRLIEKGLNNQINPTFTKFILQTKAGFITEVDRRKLENEAKQLEISETVVNIGFNDSEE